MTQTAGREFWAVEIFWIGFEVHGSAGRATTAGTDNGEIFYFFAIFKGDFIHFTVTFNGDINPFG